jgi:hypothetical protein
MRSILVGVLLAASACTGGDAELIEPHQRLPYVENGNLQLYVSNQSFDIDPVDITVELDGDVAVIGNFLVEGQHSWHVFKFEVPKGVHRLDARTEVGDATLTQSIDVNATRYAVLDYWYYPGDPDHPRMFSLYLYDEPPLFD